MPKYYFHLSDGENTLPDRLGRDLRDTSEARARAISGAADVILNLRPTILVTDQHGQHIYAADFTLPRTIISTDGLAKHFEILSRTEKLARIGGWQFQSPNELIRLTEGARKVLQLPSATALSYMQALDLFTSDSRRKLKRAVVASFRSKEKFETELFLKPRETNRRIKVSGQCSNTTSGQPTVYGIVVEIQDERKADLVWEMANHDPLTGLPNRTLFRKFVEEAISHARHVGKIVALVILDMDHLKETNDTLGHGVGDTLLKSVAERLKASIRSDDLAARIGGDEFALVLTGLSRTSEITEMVESVQSRLLHPIEGLNSVSSGASAGIAIWTKQTEDAESLQKNADIALQTAKAIGRGSLTLYSPEMRARLEKRAAGVVNARTAVRENQIVPYYQPQISLSTQKVVGLEALLRWNHPLRGALSPSSIEGAFEDPELAAAIGEVLLQDILDDISIWQAAKVPFGRVALNVSRMELIRPRYASEFLDAVEAAGVDPKFLEVEIHEDALSGRGADRVEAMLRQLQTAGVALALDDFGTGYGSLTHLRKLPIDVVKVDQSFVREMESDRFARAIICGLIKMTSNMNIKLVAEGVETANQLTLLRNEGVDIVQGFYFAPALDATETLDFLNNWQTVGRGAFDQLTETGSEHLHSLLP